MRCQTIVLRCFAFLFCAGLLACGTEGSNAPADAGTSMSRTGGTSGSGSAGSGGTPGGSGGVTGSGGRAGNPGSGGSGGVSVTSGAGGFGTGGAGTSRAGADGASGGTSGTAGGGPSETTGRGGTSGTAGRGGASGATGSGGLAGTAGAGGTLGTAGTTGAGGSTGSAVPLDPSLLSYCTGTNPIVCAIPVPANGNYNVTMELGSATKAATTRVQAELLRIELQPTTTAAGAFFQYTFTVNVRAEVHNVYSAPGKVLNLLFDGTAPALHGVGFAPAPSSATIFVAGDSTVCD